MRKCVTGYGRPQAASMPLEGVPQSVKIYAILLRNPQPEKVHGKPGHAIPLPPSRKKIPPVRPRPPPTQHLG